MIAADSGFHNIGPINFENHPAMVLVDSPIPSPLHVEPDMFVRDVERSRTFDGAEVEYIRVVAKVGGNQAGFVRCRLDDAATGRPIPGYGFGDCVINTDRVVRWNGNRKLPYTMVTLHVEVGGGMAYNGTYLVGKAG